MPRNQIDPKQKASDELAVAVRRVERLQKRLDAVHAERDKLRDGYAAKMDGLAGQVAEIITAMAEAVALADYAAQHPLLSDEPVPEIVVGVDGSRSDDTLVSVEVTGEHVKIPQEEGELPGMWEEADLIGGKSDALNQQITIEEAIADVEAEQLGTDQDPKEVADPGYLEDAAAEAEAGEELTNLEGRWINANGQAVFVTPAQGDDLWYAALPNSGGRHVGRAEIETWSKLIEKDDDADSGETFQDEPTPKNPDIEVTPGDAQPGDESGPEEGIVEEAPEDAPVDDSGAPRRTRSILARPAKKPAPKDDPFANIDLDF